MKPAKNINSTDSNIYLVGSGIASLASATYLIKDAGIPGKNIHILEQDDKVGGACDGAGDVENGFIVRGGRMHEEHFVCYWDLLSNIPSYEDPDITVKDESFEFSSRFVTDSKARLVKDGKKLDVSSFGLSLRDQRDLFKLTFVSENSLGNKRIEDWFSQDFFATKFWYIWTSMFAFQKWSSVAEMRRYMKRFIALCFSVFVLSSTAWGQGHFLHGVGPINSSMGGAGNGCWSRLLVSSKRCSPADCEQSGYLG